MMMTIIMKMLLGRRNTYFFIRVIFKNVKY